MASDRIILHLVEKKNSGGGGGADPDPLHFKNYGVHTIKPELRPCTDYRITFLTLLNFKTTSKQI